MRFRVMWYHNISRVYNTEIHTIWPADHYWSNTSWMSICLWWGWTGGDYSIDPRLGMVKWDVTRTTLFTICMLNCFYKTNKSFQWGSNMHMWYPNISRVYNTEIHTIWPADHYWSNTSWMSICLWRGWTGGGDYSIDPRLGMVKWDVTE